MQKTPGPGMEPKHRRMRFANVDHHVSLMYVELEILLTSSEADPLSSLYLRSRQRHAIDLHARDPSTEVPQVTWQRSHSDWSVSS